MIDTQPYANGFLEQAEVSPKIPHLSDDDLGRMRQSKIADPLAADIDVEMDMDEGPEMAVAEGLPMPRAAIDPLGRPVDLEYELDRDDPECVSVEELHNPKVRAAMAEALGRPVDLEFELDHDDPECVDLEDLHNPKAKKAALEALGRPVNLDDEMDLMHENEESPSGTMAGNTNFNTGQKAGPANVGQYREANPKVGDKVY
ncbi:hypothetical protein N2152v2_001377 [Parachlorella kessleri]